MTKNSDLEIVFEKGKNMIVPRGYLLWVLYFLSDERQTAHNLSWPRRTHVSRLKSSTRVPHIIMNDHVRMLRTSQNTNSINKTKQMLDSGSSSAKFAINVSRPVAESPTRRIS